MIKNISLALLFVFIVSLPQIQAQSECSEGQYRCSSGGGSLSGDRVTTPIYSPWGSVVGSASTGGGLPEFCQGCHECLTSPITAYAYGFTFGIADLDYLCGSECHVCEGLGEGVDETAGRWQQPCGVDNQGIIPANLVWKWSGYNNILCANGCDYATGVCITSRIVDCHNKCSLGDRKCLSDNVSIVQCMDTNADGCTEWSGQLVDECCLAYDAGHNCVLKSGCTNGYCNNAQPVRKQSAMCYDIVGAQSLCGGIGGRYSVKNFDSDSNGCLDYNDIGTYCRWGCVNGQCADGKKGCINYCDEGETQCTTKDGISYTKTCVATPGTVCNEFDNNWRKCPNGCGLVNGKDDCLSFSIDEQLQYPHSVDNQTIALYTFDDSSNSSIVKDVSGNARHLTMWPGSCVSNPTACAYYQPVLTKFGANSMQMLPPSTPYGWSFSYPNYTSPSKNGTIEFWFLMSITEDANWAIPFVWYSYNYSLQSVLEIRIYHNYDFYQIGLVDASGVVKYMNLTALYGWSGALWTGSWHHMRVTWGNNMTLYIDGEWVGSVPYTPVSFNVGRNSIHLGGMVGDTGGDFWIYDDIRISSIERSWYASFIDECYEPGTHVCRGIGKEYQMDCLYDPRSRGNIVSKTGLACDYGCNDETGLCFANASDASPCNAYDNKCFYENGREISATCNDLNGDSVYTWQESTKQDCGEPGCEASTGMCRNKHSDCMLNESRCLGGTLSPGENLMPQDGFVDIGLVGNSIRLFCKDTDNDGYYEWDVNGTKPCPWGCSQDNIGGQITSWCNEAPNDLLRYQGAVNYAGNAFAVAFEGPVFRFVISIVAFMVAFGLGMYFTKSVTFGFGSGIGVLGVAIAAGWVPVVFVLAIFGIAAYMVFKAWTGGELTG